MRFLGEAVHEGDKLGAGLLPGGGRVTLLGEEVPKVGVRRAPSRLVQGRGEGLQQPAEPLKRLRGRPFIIPPSKVLVPAAPPNFHAVPLVGEVFEEADLNLQALDLFLLSFQGTPVLHHLFGQGLELGGFFHATGRGRSRRRHAGL